MNSDFDALLNEIDPGVIVFAWTPVRVMTGAGWFRDGWQWLTRVRKRRCIGHPSYYYERLSYKWGKASED